MPESHAGPNGPGEAPRHRRPARFAELAHRARELFRIDARFREEYRALRLLLRLQDGLWADRVLAGLERCGGFPGGLRPGDRRALETALRHHANLVLLGKFDEEYAASLEDVAAGLARAATPVLAALAAWNEVRSHFMDFIVQDERMTDRLLRRDAYRSLAGWIAVETGLLAHLLATGPAPPEARGAGSG